MVRLFFSPASKKGFRKLFALVTVLILAPLGLSYWHVHQWLALENCVLYQSYNNDTIASSNDITPANRMGLICMGQRNGPYFFDTTFFSQSPPSISRMITILRKASVLDPSVSKYAFSTGNVREHIRKLESRKEESRSEDFYSYGYAEESLSLFDLFQKRVSGSKNDSITNAKNVDTSYGFRRNPNKNASSSAFAAASSSRIPVATYFWLVLNVGLYGWYLYKKVDPGTVSLNGQLLRNGGDFGRAFSGNLAHFEIWHLGLNAMSLISLGEALEYDASSLAMGGTVGLLLWTASFVALVTVVVVVLYIIDRRFGAGLWRRGSSHTFPRMVGFSGVLFAWSVARTLSLSEYQQTCPIPFFSNICFSTHRLAGGFRFSWGPIVQLVFVQILLHKRVSFVGHLSGTIVGFLWHWGLLPPLELSQPSVLYPILWMVGKSVVHRWNTFFDALGSTSEELETGSIYSRGSYLSGGQVLGTVGNRWTLSRDQDDEIDNETKSGKILLLKVLQKFACAHVVAMIFAYRKDHSFVLVNSMVLSELLLLLVYSLFAKSVETSGNKKNEKGHPLACLGVLGRAYVTFAVVAIVTEAMTMGGWWAMLLSREIPFFVTMLLIVRIPLWIISIAITCYMLDSANELQMYSGNGNASETGSVGGGIWSHVLGRTIVEPCLLLGKYISKAKWNNFDHATPSIALVSTQESNGVTSGRSTSNVAGKSRLVDRGTASNRGIV